MGDLLREPLLDGDLLHAVRTVQSIVGEGSAT
jgi:hypothetical protein